MFSLSTIARAVCFFISIACAIATIYSRMPGEFEKVEKQILTDTTFLESWAKVDKIMARADIKRTFDDLERHAEEINSISKRYVALFVGDEGKAYTAESRESLAARYVDAIVDELPYLERGLSVVAADRFYIDLNNLQVHAEISEHLLDRIYLRHRSRDKQAFEKRQKISAKLQSLTRESRRAWELVDSCDDLLRDVQANVSDVVREWVRQSRFSSQGTWSSDSADQAVPAAVKRILNEKVGDAIMAAEKGR